MKHSDMISIFLSILALGGALVGYAHSNFATKSQADMNLKISKEIKQDLAVDISEIKQDIRYIRQRLNK